jgi:hypothetical protein
MGWDGIGTAIGTVASWFTPEQRTRRLRDELEKLSTERSKILVHKADEKSARRLSVIDSRIDVLNGLLKNR